MKHKCVLCNGKLENSKKLIIKNGSSATINTEQCAKCGHSFSTPEESERVRKELNPIILDKIKGFFHNPSRIESLSFFRRKVL